MIFTLRQKCGTKFMTKHSHIIGEHSLVAVICFYCTKTKMRHQLYDQS